MEMRERGVAVANWKLDDESREYLKKYFEIEPDLYLVQTRKYYGVEGFPRILKDLNYAARQGKAYVTIHLKEHDKIVLDEADISYKALRYNIVLI